MEFIDVEEHFDIPVVGTLFLDICFLFIAHEKFQWLRAFKNESNTFR